MVKYEIERGDFKGEIEGTDLVKNRRGATPS